ncbi:MAG: CpsB/CapC family capsule biosynthesis tyrosine phosphatase [Planctomycetota bacterium]
MANGFVDIHCHLVPGIDDGASDASESLAMALLAVDEGIETVVVTPHQLGSFAKNTGDEIRVRVVELQELLDANGVPLKVLPGADVRIDAGMVKQIADGQVLSLGDHRKHVLLELPHELYLPLEPVLDELAARGMVGVLSHPERNLGILNQPGLVRPLVEAGCLMQVTAGSLTGGFGPASQALAEDMCRRGLVHFLATDAHGPKSRRPKIRQAYERACELAGVAAADLWCREYPRRVASGGDVPAGIVPVAPARRSGWSLWKRAG